MKVYVLEFDNEGEYCESLFWEYLGSFSTQELAEEYQNSHQKQRNGWELRRGQYRISMEELDPKFKE